MEVEFGGEASERNLDCLRIQLVETDGRKVALRLKIIFFCASFFSCLHLL